MRQPAREQGQRWLPQAQADMGWVRHLAVHGAHYLVCFLCQQAAEKALKAVLYATGVESVLSHSVRQLTERIAAQQGTDGAVFAVGLDRWAMLDSYYIPTRYPNGLPAGIPAQVYNSAAAASALELAEDVLMQVEQWFAATEDPQADANGTTMS